MSTLLGSIQKTVDPTSSVSCLPKNTFLHFLTVRTDELLIFPRRLSISSRLSFGLEPYHGVSSEVLSLLHWDIFRMCAFWETTINWHTTEDTRHTRRSRTYLLCTVRVMNRGDKGVGIMGFQVGCRYKLLSPFILLGYLTIFKDSLIFFFMKRFDVWAMIFVFEKQILVRIYKKRFTFCFQEMKQFLQVIFIKKVKAKVLLRGVASK